LGFGDAEAAEHPLAIDELVDQAAGVGGGGLVVLVEVGGELFEVGEVFGGEDEGFGVDAGFEGVHGGSGFACDRSGTGGFLGVTAVCFDLTQSGHGGSRGWGQGTSGYARLSYFEDRGRGSRIRGDDVCILLKIGRKDSEMFV
jgi:hypothetical protein